MNISQPNKNSFILYQNKGIGDIHYIVAEKHHKNLITVKYGILHQENDNIIETYEFSETNEANLFFEKLKIEKSIIYNFNPYFEVLKIGLDLKHYNEDELIDTWFNFTEVLESYLLNTGIGFIPDDYYYEINRINDKAFTFENGLHIVKISTINKFELINFIKEYLANKSINFYSI